MKNVTYINAGAGSGKTTKLTELLSQELSKPKDPYKPSEVILTTFTELAAAEFRERARQRLYKNCRKIRFCYDWHRSFSSPWFYPEILVSGRHLP